MERYKIKKIDFELDGRFWYWPIWLVSGLSIIICIAILFSLMGCANGGQPKSNEVILKFESEIPIRVTIHKDCTGNWNFCDVGNWNFQKWEE